MVQPRATPSGARVVQGKHRLQWRSSEVSLTDCVAIIRLEAKASASTLHDLKATIVVAAVVESTKQDDVVAIGWAAIDPVVDMVSFGSMCRDAAAWEAAKAIADLERTA